MSKISKYDEKQLNLMLNQLSAFENKKLDLSSLVGNLEGLLHAMEHVTDEWEEKFLNAFSTLESINAEMPKLKNEEIEKLIKDAVANLKKLVQKKLARFKSGHLSSRFTAPFDFRRCNKG